GHATRLLDAWKKAEPYPDAVDALRKLEDFDLGIISNIDDDILSALLRGAGWEDRFRVVVTSETTRTYKPRPGIFREALRRAQRAAERSLHLGDSPVEDVGGAKGSGMMAGWVDREGTPRSPGWPEADFSVPDLVKAADLILATKPGS
ncbi:MAG: HAD family hydrolase, partial [Thermoplasmata archaeon]|nr:HAD family hydrolase [Thermoplasmata archaeon]